MKRLVVAVLCLLYVFCALSITSKVAAQTKLKYALMPVEGFSYQGHETHPLAPSMTMGLALAHKWGEWGWATEGGIATPFSQANPSPQVVFGPVWFMSDKFYLNLNGSARYNPVQKDKQDSLAMGLGFVFGIVINKETTLGTGIGMGKVVSGEPGPWCFTIGPKLSFTLF
ncbi:MAG: hypothetical protein WC750_05845 [Patescibacteria group bacterium]|jgi:hypothetical protein